MTQYFKGDATEIKFDEGLKDTLDTLSAQKTLFFEDAYDCQAFGDIIFSNNLAPLANAISQEIFRDAFNEVFQNFEVAGSFESYIAVFKKIFGDDVDIEFVIPASGRLQINITSTDVVLYDFVGRYIENNEYIFDEIIDYEGDNIALQTIKGFQTEYELEQMLRELVPVGIFTEITLSVGV